MIEHSWGDQKPALAPVMTPKRRLVFDIETDGLYDEVTKIHCLVAIDYDSAQVFAFRPHEIEKGLAFLATADQIEGHNIIGYDLAVIAKLYPKWAPKIGVKVRDSLVISKVIWPALKESDFQLHRKGKLSAKNIGKHSLKAWGERIGLHKDDFGETSDWKEFSEEMLEYCIQDVKVNCRLINLIDKKDFPDHVIQMEQSIHKHCLDQERFGFPFNVKKAQILLGKLLTRKAELNKIISDDLGPCWVRDKGIVVPEKTINYKDPTKGRVMKDAAYHKIEIIEFNPSSRTHLAKRLVEKYGWEPEEYGDDGHPTLSEDVLDKLKWPIAKHISEYLMIGKRLGQLAEGKQAWINLEKDGKIHGRVDTMGAVTARCSHHSPNLAQIPSVRAPYGHDCRELFETEADELLLGCDVSGLELRMLAHYMAKWDGGEYGRVILDGDIHTANQNAAGLPTRDNAKTFIYGFLYGAGDAKIAEIINGTAKDGKRLREKFLKNTPALKQLREQVDMAVEMKGQLKAIDGRIIPVRHKHAALNSLLQSAGAIVCKMWVVRFHELMAEAGYIHGVHYKQAAYVHDEMQIRFKKNVFHVESYTDAKGKKHFKTLIGDICVQAIKETGEKLNIRLPLTGEYSVGTSYADTH